MGFVKVVVFTFTPDTQEWRIMKNNNTRLGRGQVLQRRRDKKGVNK
jgi:hypothetical protein